MSRSENSFVLPRMWLAPNYRDPALEVAHREMERLQRVVALQQLLLDEATSRISELAKYQHKAAKIITRLTAKIRDLRTRKWREGFLTKDAGRSMSGVRAEHRELRHSALVPSNQGMSGRYTVDFVHDPSMPARYTSRIQARPR
ncbi:MAG TPA: hypothetical protein VGB27_05360 [Candidatus Binatia bacterium]